MKILFVFALLAFSGLSIWRIKNSVVSYPHTGTAHTGTAHTGTAHTGTAHTGAAHTGAAHTGAAHTGAALIAPPSLPPCLGNCEFWGDFSAIPTPEIRSSPLFDSICVTGNPCNQRKLNFI